MKGRLVDPSVLTYHKVHGARRILCGEWWVERVFSEYLVLRNVRTKVTIVPVAALVDYTDTDSYDADEISKANLAALGDKCLEALISVGALAAQDVSLDSYVQGEAAN